VRKKYKPGKPRDILGVKMRYGSKSSRRGRVLEWALQGKHYAVLKEMDYVKRYFELVKSLTLSYPIEKKDLVLQVTVKEPGKYLLYVVAKKGTSVLHRFYLKDSSVKTVKSHTYHVLTIRVPAELRGSTLYIKIFRVP
jgi:hypothetical protein